MSVRISKLSREAEGRYFTRDEQQQMLGYAASLQQRFKAAAAVEAKEDAAVKAVIEEVKRRYPNFARYHDQAWAKCYRDVQLVVRYDAQAMVLDDVKWLDDKMLYWLRTILAASNFTPQLVRDTYTALRDLMKQQLPADAYELMAPYLDRNVEVLGDFPEPATPAV